MGSYFVFNALVPGLLYQRVQDVWRLWTFVGIAASWVIAKLWLGERPGNATTPI